MTPKFESRLALKLLEGMMYVWRGTGTRYTKREFPDSFEGDIRICGEESQDSGTKASDEYLFWILLDVWEERKRKSNQGAFLCAEDL